MESFDICKEIGNTAWINAFHFQLNITKEIFHENLKKFTGNIEELQKRQEPVATLREKILGSDVETVKEVNEIYRECGDLEKKIQDFETAPKEWEKEGKSQILFTQEWAKPLNHIPFVLPTAAIFKIYIFPFFAVILPLMAWILPWVIVRFFFGMNMPFEFYKKAILNMWLGGKPWSSMDFWGQTRVLFQTTWTLFGIFQGMYQPVQQALHTKVIDDTILKQGILLQEFLNKVNRLLVLLEKIKGKPVSCAYLSEIPMDEPRQTYAYLRDHPKDLVWILRKIAEEEVNWRLACALELNFAEFTKGSPSLEIDGFFDPAIPVQHCVTSSITLKKNDNHSLLTGPNKGGKSSTLRAICLNVWFAQTFGMVFAQSAKLTPFAWIRSGLRLADLPGSESLFEREILFAAKTLRLASSKKPGLVLYDECFHSTNPPDGEKTAKLFLNSLWKSENTLSIVSTHVFSLVESAPSNIKRLCMPAEKNGDTIVYTYRLAPGICKVSSVEEIYRRFRFPSAVKT